MQVLITQREALVAANQQRLASGLSVAYSADHFDGLANDMEELIEKIDIS